MRLAPSLLRLDRQPPPPGRIVPADPGKQLPGTITGAFMPSRPGAPREHEATRLLLKAAMQTTRRAAGPSAGDLITAGSTC